jgi:uncharacterized protein YkwD
MRDLPFVNRARLLRNLASTGEPASPYGIFSSWMHSALHRANILDPAFRDVGFAFAAVRSGRTPLTRLWVAEFGRH